MGLGSDGRLWGKGKESVKELPVSGILLSPYQARRGIEPTELQELIDSIRTHGVLQPVLVRPFGGGYELVAGERRVRACKAAGVKTIPAVIKDLSDKDAALLGLVENLQRENLDYFEEAQGYRTMVDEFGLTQQELAQMLGKSQPAIANRLRLLKLEENVRKACQECKLSERHARALLKVPGTSEQLRVIEEIKEGELSVRETEELIERLYDSEDRKDGLDRNRRVVHVVKDIRIFLNSFRQTVSMLKKSGIDVDMEERDEGERIELIVRIPK